MHDRHRITIWLCTRIMDSETVPDIFSMMKRSLRRGVSLFMGEHSMYASESKNSQSLSWQASTWTFDSKASVHPATRSSISREIREPSRARHSGSQIQNFAIRLHNGFSCQLSRMGSIQSSSRCISWCFNNHDIKRFRAIKSTNARTTLKEPIGMGCATLLVLILTRQTTHWICKLFLDLIVEPQTSPGIG